MSTFEEANRLRLEGNEALYDYGDVSSISVTQLDTSYVLLVVYKGRYKKRPPENFYIGAVKVIAVKEGDEDVVQADGPKISSTKTRPSISRRAHYSRYSYSSSG